MTHENTPLHSIVTADPASANPSAPFDLVGRARQAMWDEGFVPDLSPEALAQLTAAPPVDKFNATIHDLRDLLWSSIDNPDSRDLDQVEWAERLENGDIRLLVGVADVDCRVPQGTPLDAHALRSTTSVYTGVVVFPMLPEVLSTDRTSLNPDEDRLALVVDMIVNKEGAVTKSTVYRANLRNRAKLVYETVGPWLEGNAAAPEPLSRPELADQVRLQNEAATRLQARREQNGALELQTNEARVSLHANGMVSLVLPQRNQAHRLIENLMVAANGIVARFLVDRNIAAIQRIVKRPERWPRLVALAQSFGDTLPDEADAPALAAFVARRHLASPQTFADLSLSVVKLLGPGEYMLVRPGEDLGGHFALAAPTYTHSTAPNRRYADLITQRLVKAALSELVPPYGETELDYLAHHCTEREDAARKVERLMRKVAAALLLSNRVGETFDAVVTGVSSRKGTFVRVLAPPVEGRVVAGEEGVDVGDTIRVRLLSVHPAQGWIDFGRVVEP